MSESLEFGTKAAADTAREEFADWLCSQDDRRLKTVRFSSDIPEDVLGDVGIQADISRSDDRATYSQRALTDDEKRTLRRSGDWTWNANGFEAMHVEGALLAEGVLSTHSGPAQSSRTSGEIRDVRDRTHSRGPHVRPTAPSCYSFGARSVSRV